MPALRLSNERPISSMANTMPAIGALKAAAMPAAPPARIEAAVEQMRGKRREPTADVQTAGGDVHRRPFAADGRAGEQSRA